MLQSIFNSILKLQGSFYKTQTNVTKRSKKITLHKYTICKITLLETTNQQISKWTHHTAK